MLQRYRKIQEQRSAGESPDAGFTLIELLIVIIVLGILAGIVIVAVGNTTKNSAIASCNTDAKSVETAIAAFQADPANGGTAATASNLVPSYLQTFPNSSHYTITIVSGAVNVTANGHGPDPYDVTNNCQFAV